MTENIQPEANIKFTFDYANVGFPSPFTLTAVGFWLPCGRTNFFNHQHDQNLKISSHLYRHMHQSNIDVINESGVNIGQHLQASVFRRLSIVLFEKHFTHVYYRIPDYRRPYPEESDPDTALFVCSQPDKVNWPSDYAIPYGLMMLVNDEGYYLWIAVHECKNHKNYKVALKQYIREEMMGGSFFSHFSGLPHGRARIFDNEAELDSSLRNYRDNKAGILNFFQLNLILEGMFNYAFDERLFFSHDTDIKKINEIKKEYSLGNFSDLISTSVELKSASFHENGVSFDINQHNEAVQRFTSEVSTKIEQLYKKLHLENEAEIIAFDLIKLCLDNQQVRRDIVRQFLRTTSSETLQKLKWRIERCRRALLDEMISIMHVRRPIAQAEPPDSARDDLHEATEDQLRGYVLWVSAKLPLVKNVRRYIKTTIQNMERKNGTEVTEISGFLNSWHGLFEAIEDNLQGLENAIDQARNERLLHEEQRIRVEQEAVAEIERMREQSGRTGVDGTGESQTFKYAENILALTTVVITFLALTLQPFVPGATSPISEIVREVFLVQTIRDIVLLLLIIGPLSAIFLYFGYKAIHWILERLVRLSERFRDRYFPFRKRYYYEMDVRLDEPIKIDLIPELIEIATSRDYKQKRVKFSSETGGGQVKPIFTKPERHAYRAEIESRDEGYYKIHAVTTIYWPRLKKIWMTKWHFWQLPIDALQHLKMEAYVTYDVMYHQPSGEHSYLLRECRLATTHSRRLTTQQLYELKVLFADGFINPWLHDNNQIKPDSLHEPLFAMTRNEIR